MDDDHDVVGEGDDDNLKQMFPVSIYTRINTIAPKASLGALNGGTYFKCRARWQQHRGETHAPKWRPETIACQI